jgi:hypothetical protein
LAGLSLALLCTNLSAQQANTIPDSIALAHTASIQYAVQTDTVILNAPDTIQLPDPDHASTELFNPSDINFIALGSIANKGIPLYSGSASLLPHQMLNPFGNTQQYGIPLNDDKRTFL